MKEDILKRLESFKGDVGFYYKNLVTYEVIKFNEEKRMLAASLIKLPILVDSFNQIKKGIIRKDDVFVTCEENKVPSCGALNYMHSSLEVTLEDLYALMIILSDNYATNILIDKLGINNINNTIKDMGLENTVLNRKMFDDKKSDLGVENYISTEDIFILLEKMYNNELIDESSSKEMINVLKNQRLNGKIPFFLHSESEKIQIAHKTGEDKNITHDVGIVFAKEPFIICFTGNNVNVPEYERLMQDISYELYLQQKEE
ncbi:MAG: serine hydrolase [Terrisporobacter sp.]|uniref:serine hydrolase n=1 Tax=Terrisporobacter sp. TaxID=1965305 RepID=UPI002FC71F29